MAESLPLVFPNQSVGDQFHTVYRILADIDQPTANILREVGVLERVVGHMAEAAAAQEPISILTAIAALPTYLLQAVISRATKRDFMLLDEADFSALESVVKSFNHPQAA